jgi:hypothetical protein
MEIVLEGTRDDPAAGDPRWTPYEWKCKPGDPARRPCLMSPYHHRLDWLIWFAAMRGPAEDPWAVHLVAKLLDGEPRVLALLAGDPFEGRPPRFIRAELYRYRLASMGAPRFWERTRVGEWLPPLGRDDPGLRAFLHKHGWFRRTAP